jgi:hypothetical protein
VHGHDAFLVRAMGATIVGSAGFYAVSQDFAPAVLAFRGQSVNRAFEAIKIMGDSIANNLERFVVLVSAHFAVFHFVFLR